MTTPGSNGPDQQPGGGAPGWGQPPAGSSGGYSPPPPPPRGATPPSAGGFPQGQYPGPQGGAQYPPQGGAQYPQQGGAQYPPQGGAQYPQQGASPIGGPPARSGPPKWLIPLLVVAALVAAALAYFVVFAGPDFEEGDCLRQASSDEVEEVDCDDSAAEVRVIGVHDEDLTEDEFFADDTTCSDFPETVNQVWVAKTFGDSGTIYCTVPVG